VSDVDFGKANCTVAALVAVALGLTGCSPGGTEPAPQVAESEAPDAYAGDGLPDLALEEVPLAGEPVYAEADRSAVHGIAAGRVLATRPGDLNVIMLDAYDATTGELAWDITTSEAAQLVFDAGFGSGRLEFAAGAVQRGGPGYAVPLFSNGSETTPYRSGLIMLDATGGSVVWTSDLTPHLGDDVEGISVHTDVVDATSDVVIANIEAQSADGAPMSMGAVVDASSGELRWVERGIVLSSIAGDVVTAIRTEDPRDDQGALVGIDAASGEQMWEAGSAGEWIGGTGTIAAAWTPEAALFATASGEPVDVGAILSAPVAADDIAAWLDPDEHAVVTYAAGDERPWPGAAEVVADEVTAIDAAGYVWVASGAQTAALDRTGAARSDSLVGAFAGAGGGSVVTVEESGAVHLWRDAG